MQASRLKKLDKEKYYTINYLLRDGGNSYMHWDLGFKYLEWSQYLENILMPQACLNTLKIQ